MIPLESAVPALYFIEDLLLQSRRCQLTGTGRNGFSMVSQERSFSVVFANALDLHTFICSYERNQRRGIWTVPIFYADRVTALRPFSLDDTHWQSSELAPFYERRHSVISLSPGELVVYDLLQKHLGPTEARLTYFKSFDQKIDLITFSSLPALSRFDRLGCIEDDLLPGEKAIPHLTEDGSHLGQLVPYQQVRGEVIPLFPK